MAFAMVPIMIGGIIIGPAIAGNSIKTSPLYPVYSEIGKNIYFVDIGCASIGLEQLTTAELEYRKVMYDAEEFYSSPIEITDDDLNRIPKINQLIEKTRTADFESNYDVSLSPAELDDHKKYLEDKFAEQHPDTTKSLRSFLIQHNEIPYSVGFSRCGS